MDIIVPPTPSLVLMDVRCWLLPGCCRQPAAAIVCLYVYDLPLWLASTTCLYSLPLRPASTACLYAYGLPLRLRLLSAFIISSSSLSSPLSISCSSGTSIFLFFICDLYFLLLHFLKLFSISFSKYAVEECDTYLLLTQSLPCYYCLTVFVLFLPMCAVPATLLPSIFCLGSQIPEQIFSSLIALGDILLFLKGYSHETAYLILFLVYPAQTFKGGMLRPT
jgi:hypothetical protein